VADFDRVKFRVTLDNPTYRKIADQEKSQRTVRPGNLLLEKSGGGDGQPVGAVVFYDHTAEAVCSNFVARMELADQMAPRYWSFFHAAAYHIRLNVRSIKQTSGIQNLDQNSYLDERGVFPPLAEQIVIANFLDRETAKIDALVEAQERLIELLTERRQTGIAHSITRGLDPNVKMKHSGVEWLGRVPEHWEVTRLASLFNEVSENGNDDLPILSVSIHYGVSNRELDEGDLDRKVTRSEDKSKYKRVRKGDLVYNMMRAWQGGFGSVTTDGIVSPAYVVARPLRSFRTDFIEFALRTTRAIEEMRRYSRGVTDFRLRLYWEEFKDIKIALPPLSEQEAIMSSIQEHTAMSERLVSHALDANRLLEERRSALISDAVTGKLDLRNIVESEDVAA
jgi:type I restriction enzyme S subunit